MNDVSAAVASSRLIRGTGTSETLWRQWFAANRLQTVEASRWVEVGVRAVVIAPHPDDEVLALGGTLATLVNLGRDICIVAVSDGGASHPPSVKRSRRALEKQRRDESVESWRHLGLSQLAARRFQLPDGDIAAHGAELKDMLQRELRQTDVVFATWRHDGHPDHEAVGHAAASVCTMLGCSLIEYPVWMWHWAQPGEARVPWGRLRGLALSGQSSRCKRLAVAAHQSQVWPDDDGHPPIVAPWALARLLRPFEVVFAPE